MDPQAELNAGNLESQAALRALVGRLTEADLARDLGEGWTVTAMLAHMGFYDARVLALFRRWEAGGEVKDSPLDPHAINEAMLPYLQLLPGRAVAERTLALAAECDAAIAALTPEQLRRMEAAGYPARLDRAHHRREHVEQIERALEG
jgi:hypothetical protein